MNIISLADDNIRKNGEKLAFVFNEKEYANAWIDEKARKLATGLKSLGIVRGDHVVVSMPNSPEVFVAFQAVWRIGAVIIPIMFLLGEEETRYILDHSDAKAVITSRDLMDKIVKAKEGLDHVENVIVLGKGDEGEGTDFYGLVDQSPAETTTEDMADDDVALMIYTSGTTGKPKGVMLTHRNLYSNALAAWEANEWDKAPVSVLCLPMAHSFGVVAMNAGNLSPYPESFAVLMTWFDPEGVFRLIEKYKANNFIGVPTMYQLLLAIPEADKYDTSSLERCTISAAPVSEELYRAFTTKFDCKMYEGYGLTEAAPAVALCRPGMPFKKGSCGAPLPGVEVAVVDNEDKPLPTGEQGEILVRGENVMKGYYKRPEETKEAFRGGWLHTGDIGYLDEDNYLFITDRLKDMIIKGGYNIYPSEIEGFLEEHPAIGEVSVIGISNDRYGEEVMAFVVTAPGQELTEEAVIAFSESKMTKFKAPSRVTFLDALPKTLTGKVEKKELRKMV